jgi:hypothetical protein
VNFLSHYVVLPERSSPLVRVGASLPDLWPALPERPRPRLLINELRARDEARARDLALGIDMHLRADAAFHTHPEFFRRMRLLRPELCAVWPALGEAEFASHLLVEMLLDQWLIAERPGLLADYYGAFDDATLDFAAAHGATPGTRDALRALFARFVAVRFLDDYVTPEGLVPRFVGALGRTPFAPSGETPLVELVAFVARWAGQLKGGSGELVAFVRDAVSTRD